LTDTVLTVVRHGETEWSRSGQHTSRTDLDLTDAGATQARDLGAALAGIQFDLVLCSPRRRAQRTAELAGLVPFTTDDDLAEWDYGDLEGLTTPEIQARYPGWSIWAGPWPGGETAVEVAARADRLIDRIVASGRTRVALIGHGHFSRVVAVRWVDADLGAGRWLDLDTATWSELGWSRAARVLRRWNVPVPAGRGGPAAAPPATP
jgi:probable phosphoglycerate mutase